MTVVAALFVDERGIYSGRPDVEVWGPSRDARLYPGPNPVVAHPPCARWGNYWFGSPSSPVRLKLGDDDGCFQAALKAVETWGGVLEHPAGSRAWKAFGIPKPARGSWLMTSRGGWTTEVEQGRYGHQARKPTWLYAHGNAPPGLDWRPSQAEGRPDTLRRSRGQRTPNDLLERLSHRQRAATPAPFAELLLSIARACAKAS